MSTQVKRPVVTREEHEKWSGKAVTTSTYMNHGKHAGTVRVTEYKVLSVARFGPDKPLMLEVGRIDTMLGSTGSYIFASDATLKQ